MNLLQDRLVGLSLEDVLNKIKALARHQRHDGP